MQQVVAALLHLSCAFIVACFLKRTQMISLKTTWRAHIPLSGLIEVKEKIYSKKLFLEESPLSSVWIQRGYEPPLWSDNVHIIWKTICACKPVQWTLNPVTYSTTWTSYYPWQDRLLQQLSDEEHFTVWLAAKQFVQTAFIKLWVGQDAHQGRVYAEYWAKGTPNHHRRVLSIQISTMDLQHIARST